MKSRDLFGAQHLDTILVLYLFIDLGTITECTYIYSMPMITFISDNEGNIAVGR